MGITQYKIVAEVRIYSDKALQVSCQTVYKGSYAGLRRKYNQLPSYPTFNQKYFGGYSYFLGKNDNGHSVYLTVTKAIVTKVKGGEFYEYI